MERGLRAGSASPPRQSSSMCLVALTSAAVVSLKPSWSKVAVRVAGSWIGAVGVLSLGWLASGR